MNSHKRNHTQSNTLALNGYWIAIVLSTSLFKPLLADTALPSEVNPTPISEVETSASDRAPKSQKEGGTQPTSESSQKPFLYSFEANGIDLKQALALFAKANQLNIVPDHDVTGTVTLSVQNLPLERIMQALLEAYDYSWDDQDGLIRVRSTETRVFKIDYLRLNRVGMGQSSANLTASGRGSSGSSSGSGAGSGGGGNQNQGGSIIHLTQENPVDFWEELKTELSTLLSEKGKTSLAINETAGIIQIKDRPSALKAVESYLERVHQSALMQVDIQAKLYDVTLSDQTQYGIDWKHGFNVGNGTASMVATPTALAPSALGGGAPQTWTTLFSNADTDIVLQALKQQGNVEVISQPRLRTLNNQTALIKVGTEMPFFNQTTTFLPGTLNSNTAAFQSDQIQLITIGTILYITPQIGDNGIITMDLSPVITTLVDTRTSPSKATTAPVLDIKQASTLVRIPNGSTIVIGGLIQETTSEDERKVPLLGDIPALGALFRSKQTAKEKKELVIFLTPTIVE